MSNSRGGFTLVEMMAVVLIAAIVLTAGVPALQGMVRRQRLIGAANDFFHAAHLTRATALRHGNDARMSPLNGDDWASGWKIIVNDQLVMTRPALAPGIAVRHHRGGAEIGYRANGLPRNSSTWFFASGRTERRVVINFLGRIRICDPAPKGSC